MHPTIPDPASFPWTNLANPIVTREMITSAEAEAARLRGQAIAAAIAGLGAAVAASVTAVVRWAVAVHRRWQDNQHLLAMDDRMLRDIGLSRVDIVAAVRGDRVIGHMVPETHPAPAPIPANANRPIAAYDRLAA